MREFWSEWKKLIAPSAGKLKVVFRPRKAMPEKEVQYLKQSRADTNIICLFVYAILMILLQISNLLIESLGILHSDYVMQYELGNLFILVVSAGALCAGFFMVRNRAGARQKHLLHLLFWVLCSLGTMYICYLEALDRSETYNFILLLSATALFPRLDWREALLLFGMDFGLYLWIVLEVGMEPRQVHLAVLIVIGSALVSQILTASYCSSRLAQRSLENFARTDALTGLPGRYGFEMAMGERWQGEGRAVAAIADIDDFKCYNDAFEHLAGDDCLKAVAGCLQRSFPEDKGLLCRYGGEEFVFFFQNVSEQSAEKWLEKARALVEEMGLQASPQAGRRTVTISIGYAAGWMRRPGDFEALLRQADSALYTAKRSGKNRLERYPEEK